MYFGIVSVLRYFAVIDISVLDFYSNYNSHLLLRDKRVHFCKQMMSSENIVKLSSVETICSGTIEQEWKIE